MKKIMVGECAADSTFDLVDPTSFIESDFEAEAVKALMCLQPDYFCGIFAGKFFLEGDCRIPDLALIHKNMSHWFVVEVELANHSFERHVLPQVRCFRYGEPDESCITSLVRGFPNLNLSCERAETLLKHIPRYVAVVGNIPNTAWTNVLRALDTQYLTVSVYRNHVGCTAYEMEGFLVVPEESLGFAIYSATDNCFRIQKISEIPIGDVQITDQFGNIGNWTVQETDECLWISKNKGYILVPHNSYVQIIRTSEGRIFLRLAQ